MAARTYRVAAGQDGNFGSLSEADVTAANRTDGWTSAKLAAPLSSEFDAATKKASGTFSSQVSVPKPNVLVISTAANAFKTAGVEYGSFDVGTWTFTFALRCTTASSQRGRMLMRVFKALADGSGATELTTGILVGTTVAAALSTSADQTSVITWNPGATVVLDGEFLFFALAWEVTTAGGSNSADVVIRTGQSAGGSRLVTPNWVAGTPPAPDYTTSIDDFNRADGLVDAGAGADIWNRTYYNSAVATDVRVASNRIKTSTADWMSAWTKGVTTADCDILIDCIIAPVAPNLEFGMFFCVTDGGTPTFDGYGIFWGNGTWFMRRYLNGTNMGNIATGAGSLIAGDTIWIRKRGSDIKLYRGQSGLYTKILQATDANHTAGGAIVVEFSDTTQTWDNLRGGPYAVPVTFPLTSLLDDFNRANQYPLGGNWLGSFRANGWKVQSNAAYGTPDGFDDSVYLNLPKKADVEAYCTIAAVPAADGYEFEVRTRWDRVANSYYEIYMTHWASSSDSIALRKIVNGTPTYIATGYSPADISVGDKVGISVIGNAVKAFHKIGAGPWVQVLSVTDTDITAAGDIGMSGRMGWAVDDFSGGGLPTTYTKTGSLLASARLSGTSAGAAPPFPTTGLLDDFNRANGSLASANWKTPVDGLSGTVSIVSNRIQSTGFAYAAWQVQEFTDCEMYVTLPVALPAFGDIELHLREKPLNPDGVRDGYYLTVYDDGTWFISKLVGGSNTNVGATLNGGPIPQVGDKIGFRAIGSNLTAYHWRAGTWTKILDRTDTTHTSGYFILRFDSGDVLDDFSGGAVVIPKTYAKTGSLVAGARLSGPVTAWDFPSVGILDDFNRADGAPGANWSYPAGSETKIASNRLTTQNAGLNGYGSWNVAPFTDTELYFTVPVLPTGNPLTMRWRFTPVNVDAGSGAYNGIQAQYNPATGVWVGYSVAAGTPTVLSGLGVTYPIAAGDSIGVTHFGSVITLWHKPAGSTWRRFASHVSAARASGFIGVTTKDPIDDFGGGERHYITTYQKTGSLLAKGVQSGLWAAERNETGSLVAKAIQSGINSEDSLKAGSLLASAVVSGPSAIDRIETGSLLATPRIYGPSVFVPPAFPLVGVVDDFNRANQYPPGSNWLGSSQANGMQVVSNQLKNNLVNTLDTVYWNAPIAADGDMFVTIAAGGSVDLDRIFLWLRRNHATNTGYVFNMTTDTLEGYCYISIQPVVNGSFGNPITSAGYAYPQPGDGIGFRVRGDKLYAYYRTGLGGAWNQILSGTDTQITAPGYAGISINRANFKLDNFGGPVAQLIHQKAGSLIAGSMLAGADVTEYTESGILVARAITSGADQLEKLRTGSLIARAIQSGAKSEESTRTGSLVARGIQSGVKSEESQKAGSLLATAIESGTKSAERNKAGSLVARGIQSGIKSREVNETGSLIATARQSGTKAEESTKQGSLLAVAVLSGADSAQYGESGSLLATARQYGTTSADKTKYGSLVAKATLSGVDAGQFSELGSLVAKAIASGADQIERTKSGSLISRAALYGGDATEYGRSGSLLATARLAGLPAFTASVTGSLIAKAVVSGTSYKTLAFLGKDLVVVYDLVAQANESLTAVYDVRRLELQDLVGKYDLRALSGKTTTGQYDLRALTLRNLIAQYDVRALRSKDLVGRYDLRALRQATLLAQYDVRVFVVRQLKANYDLRALKLANLVAQYDLIGRPSKDLLARYDLGGLRSSSFTAQYDVRVKTLVNLTAIYDLRSLRSRPVVVQYDLRALRSRQLQVQYDLRALTQETLLVIYDVQRKAFKDLAARYDLRVFTDQELVAIYDKIGRIAFDLIVKYDILGHVDTDKPYGIILRDSAIEESLIERRDGAWGKIENVSKGQSTIFRHDKGWAIINPRREE